MTNYPIGAITPGLLPAAIDKTGDRISFVWWVNRVFLFPIALVHAFFVTPSSTALNRFVKGRAKPSEAEPRSLNRPQVNVIVKPLRE